MNKSAFIKTMVEVLKYDKSFKYFERRDNLIRMLERANANFVHQFEFSNHGVSGQHWEVLEIRFPIPLLDEANELNEEINKLARYVYEESEEHALKIVEIRPLVIIEDPEEYKEYDAIFIGYRDTVIQGIRDAKFIIWVAVAWFTDNVIFQELLAKKKQGLSIRVIVSKEDQNISMIEQLRQERFELKIIEHWGDRGYNRMHHKFCIIDMDYVMHGSYNWTPAANNNDETLVTAVDHELVSKFATEFMLLFNE